ncbi:trace amine-associated receptor 13c-like [Periophthalmus magnuspinnatus]|uniref:trace amine-associated receptor 13c-like n=1 Tax=Periophthalmus magnuspinnatus TaxID=409849 RepID=UPI0024362D28|nr:trace amine-associated receptor 13c-like [Periophthalmus magnuspinnatus]XP_055086686.1 trace amine-associated receptor 13c-like [Periophthalmus magnuspinnatus]XP_055086688.1 trace amine-associated receptor 13c-like [Periophthalmus magnuspinnatus]
MSGSLDQDVFCYPHLNSSCRKPTHPYVEAMLIYVLLSCVSLITVALNLLVIISIAHFRLTPDSVVNSKWLGPNCFFILISERSIYIESCWNLGDIVCSSYYLIDYIITSASVANMVLISVDRYIAICDPLNYHTKVTMKRTKSCILLCWLLSVVYRMVIMHDQLKHPGMSNTCAGECVVIIHFISGAIDLVCTFVIPILIIIVLYLRVFVVAVSQARATRSHILSANMPQMGNVTAKKKELKAAGTLGIVVVVFLVCFCPYYVPSLLGEDTAVDASSVDVEIWLAHFNSCLNPVIYAFFYPWFRKSIKLILTMQIVKPGSRDWKM